MPKVIKEFRDKETNVIHAVGFEYEGKTVRVKELQKLGYLEEAKEVKKEDKKEDKQAKAGE